MPSVSISVVADFESHTILKGKYARFQHKGDMKNLKGTIYDIYKRILPDSDLILNINRNLIHYERYNYQFKWNNADSIIDIYIPIE